VPATKVNIQKTLSALGSTVIQAPSPREAATKTPFKTWTPVKPGQSKISWSLAKATTLPVKVTVPTMPAATVATKK
jgi:hypothetical protein